jgi:hypothetical protein
MTASKQMRAGWVITLGTLALCVVLQAAFSLLWIYRERVGKNSRRLTWEPMILWPNVVMFLLPLAVGLFLLVRGYYREVHSRTKPDDAA